MNKEVNNNLNKNTSQEDIEFLTTAVPIIKDLNDEQIEMLTTSLPVIKDYTEEEINEIYMKHQGDYFFNYDFTDEQIVSLFGFENKKQSALDKKINGENKELRKFVNLTDTTLTEEEFKSLCDRVLTAKDKEDFNDILSLSHEERIQI